MSITNAYKVFDEMLQAYNELNLFRSDAYQWPIHHKDNRREEMHNLTRTKTQIHHKKLTVITIPVMNRIGRGRRRLRVVVVKNGRWTVVVKIMGGGCENPLCGDCVIV